MPKITAYAKLFRDWEGVLGACDKNADLLPGVEPLRTAVDTVLTQVKEMKVRQEDLKGQRQALTQSLKQLIGTGGDAVRRLRDFVKVQLGAKSEHLLQFGISPLRSRPRKLKVAVKPPQPPPLPAPVEEKGAPQNPAAL